MPIPHGSPERVALFHRYVAIYVKDGYLVERRGELSADLVRKKQFSVIAFLVFSLLYLPYYLAKRDERLRVSLGDDGKLKKLVLWD